MNIVAKAGKMSEAVLDAQARGQEAPSSSSEHESLDDNDVERNVDLYILNHKVAQSKFFNKLAM